MVSSTELGQSDFWNFVILSYQNFWWNQTISSTNWWFSSINEKHSSKSQAISNYRTISLLMFLPSKYFRNSGYITTDKTITAVPQ